MSKCPVVSLMNLGKEELPSWSGSVLECDRDRAGEMGVGPWVQAGKALQGMFGGTGEPCRAAALGQHLKGLIGLEAKLEA